MIGLEETRTTEMTQSGLTYLLNLGLLALQ